MKVRLKDKIIWSESGKTQRINRFFTRQVSILRLSAKLCRVSTQAKRTIKKICPVTNVHNRILYPSYETQFVVCSIKKSYRHPRVPHSTIVISRRPPPYTDKKERASHIFGGGMPIASLCVGKENRPFHTFTL